MEISSRVRWAPAAIGFVIGAALLARSGGLGWAVLPLWVAFAWQPVLRNPRLCRWGSAAGLVVALPLTAVLAVLQAAIRHSTCGSSDMFCFGGADDARPIACLAVAAGVLSALLLVGLSASEHRRLGRVCATIGITVLSGLVVAAGAAGVLAQA